jgi:hypothetical protein
VRPRCWPAGWAPSDWQPSQARPASGTFDPEVARDKEELPFFAFGHWLVDGLAELPLSVEPVTTAARRCPEAPAGEWVEVYYEIRGESSSS